MLRLVVSWLLRIAILVVPIVLVGEIAGDHVAAFLDAAGTIPAVGWARVRLHSGAGGSVVALLAAISLISVGAQYVLFAPFSRRRIGLQLDCILAVTGRAERTVRTVASMSIAGVEEVLFRELLPTLLHSRGAGIGVAIGVPYLVFVVLHLDRKVKGIVVAAPFGIAANLVYLATGQLAWAIGLHMITNFLARGAAPEIVKVRERRIVRRAIEARAVAAG